MIKTSQLLKVGRFQHCEAHVLHVLLTVDGRLINEILLISGVLQINNQYSRTPAEDDTDVNTSIIMTSECRHESHKTAHLKRWD